MRGILDGMVERSERWVALPDGSAWLIRLVDTRRLIAAGGAELVGATAAQEALQAAQAEAEAEMRQTPPEVVEARAARRKELETQALLRRCRATPQIMTEIGQSAIVTCIAGVSAVGVVDEADEDETWFPAADAVEGIEPVRLVATEEEEDIGASPARLWVERLPEGSRLILSGCIRALGDAATRVRPFRGPAKSVAAV